jgi:hypothetical protein
MTIRLTNVTDGTTTTIHIEGFLMGVDIPDLIAAYESATATCRIDLLGLRSADTDGIQALRSLLESGAELHGANSYVRQLLYEGGK